MKAQLEVLDLLFPKTRADILRLLFSGKKRQCYVRELTILTGLALRTIQEELATMDAIGLVTSWSNRYHRFYRANRAHPLFANLRSIVQTSARLSCPKLPSHRRRRLRS
jgi:predicted transcriptional regulator